MLNIVLYQPEIPPNTGNIIRTCYALKAKLHIIKPIAFDLSPKWLKRSSAGHSLDDIDHKVYESYEEFCLKNKNIKIFYITRYGLKTYTEVNYNSENDVWLMFGRESTGIPIKILNKNISTCLRIPMYKKVRSLNLANCVAIVGYEVVRQLNYPSLSKYESQKGKLWIKNFAK